MGGLEIHDLTVARSGSAVIRNLSLNAPAGRVTALLGPNGAGKTTLLEAISGVIPASGGRIGMGDRDITRAARRRRALLGLGHIEQGRTVFTELTAWENVFVAATDRAAAEAALEYFPELEARLRTPAGLLSGGEQQMVVIARALASDVSVLLVDEMSLGLAPVIVKRLLPLFRQLAERGVAVLIVEQFAALVLKIADEAHVINRGQIRLSGTAAELAADQQRLHTAYLGVGKDVPAELPESQSREIA